MVGHDEKAIDSMTALKVFKRGAVLLAFAVSVLALAACGGESGTAAATGDSGNSVVSAGTGNSNIIPTRTPVPRRTPLPTAEPTATPGLDEVVAAGKVLFEKTAGGTGCAICHGIDAKGNTDMAAPDNRGTTPDGIWDALGRVENMSYIVLTNDEIKAISAYLQFLATQP